MAYGPDIPHCNNYKRRPYNAITILLVKSVYDLCSNFLDSGFESAVMVMLQIYTYTSEQSRMNNKQNNAALGKGE